MRDRLSLLSGASVPGSDSAVVNLDFLNLAFGTVPLAFDQWLLCVAMASVVLWFSELRKLLNRVWAGETSLRRAK